MEMKYKLPGIALLVGSTLIFLTIVLHPMGGNLDFLRRACKMIIISHGLALLALPFITYGYWGLTQLMYPKFSLGIAGFIFACFGLFGVLIAGTVNGLILPIFIDRLPEDLAGSTAMVEFILSYNFSMNQAFDLVFMVGICFAIIIWSLAILKIKLFHNTMAYLGLTASLFFLVMIMGGFNLGDITKLRYFMAVVLVWNVVMGILLLRIKSPQVEGRI
jgi:hypothetical protein